MDNIKDKEIKQNTTSISNEKVNESDSSSISSSVISPLYGLDVNKKTTIGISYHSDQENQNGKNIIENYIASNMILPTKKQEHAQNTALPKYKPKHVKPNESQEEQKIIKPRNHDNIFGKNAARIDNQLKEIKDKMSRNKINQNVVHYEQASFFDENKNLSKYREIDVKFRSIMDEIYQNNLNNTLEIVEKINDEHFFNNN